MKSKAVCIHGHFYQPSRQDPLTGEVPWEEGSAPFPNWNVRIHEHCYRPNAELGNFGRISFDIGPTLTNWMISQDSLTLAQIVRQDRQNRERYGVGNAMAQAYHHTILPLSNRNDKITQIRWGIADFEYRFGHRPTGMWLPETAVDDESLEIMADCGIEFTILAPWQADSDHLDITQPYRVELNSGKSISVFFYEREISARVSFDALITMNADSFVSDILAPRFRPDSEPQILIVATDGELYGHHKPFRDKFLARLTDGAIHNSDLELTYPALWLKQHPPTKTIKIRENTSWSCHHGVERWRGPCGCAEHGEWKLNLRRALNGISEELDQVYLQEAQKLIPDVWELRHRYIHVQHGKIRIEDLIAELAGRNLDKDEVRRLDLLLAAQVERQRMLASCGWYFEDFDRIEPRNNVNYAAQAAWLTYAATGIDITSQAVSLLKSVRSWRSGLQGDLVFLQHRRRAEEFQKMLMVMAY
jgi:alpha-amylase/alpha-mannosidase (GH57 family)